MRSEVGSLRTGPRVRFLRRAFLLAASERFQVVHHAIMGNHIHLLVEANDERALSRGMRGLGIRIARGLRRRVVQDRYHAHILTTPIEVRRARRYLLDNARHHHFYVSGFDWCASQVAMRAPRTWLLRCVDGRRGGAEDVAPSSLAPP
jgi:putative transposase